ncbi:MAG: hypothetical protein GTN86_04160 [Xanthomonadales bacterium]|nr:hypothetical protein [Xanthomonadales bacterium]NIN58685.1 hypothetical protein [Xanthomonadales bacterium]NIN74535.1 hypothetical protein [Xanthomonadales bacterium]NIO14840.1 hypothetical protein [Xanthomonadales bacterium]NIP11078.1 hypothetical protein [Xanthomonadales bacterium]
MGDPRDARPVPRPTPATAPFWAACREHRLLLQRCPACQAYQFYPRTLCSACLAHEPEWVAASGRGSVRSFTVIRHPVSPAFADEVPYVLALVRLDEGPTLMSVLRHCAPADVTIGMPVEVAFEERRDEVSLPVFRPAAGD